MWQRECDRLMGARRGGLDRIVKKLRCRGLWSLPQGWRKALRDGELRDFSGAPLGSEPQSTRVIELERLELKAGDPKLPALPVEPAWLWLRNQPRSGLSQWFQRRTQGAGSRIRRLMIVAVARRLAVELWRYLKHAVLPEGAQLKRSAAAA